MKKAARRQRPFQPFVLVLLTFLFWLSPLLGADLQVHFIDVGQGDSILVMAPNGKKLLIDAGIHAGNADPRNPFNYIANLKKLGLIDSQTIDYAVITHPHDDHYKGFSYLSKQPPDRTPFTIATVLYSLAPEPYTEYWKCVQLVIARSLHFGSLSARGPPVDMGDDIQVVVLYPFEPLVSSLSDPNDDSIVIKLTYKQISFLFMGDASKRVEQQLLDKDVTATVLKLGHHGSKTASGPDFVNKVKPVSGPFYAIISCNDRDGKGKTYGHPDRETLETLKSLADVQLYRTDLHGTVVLATDGSTIKVTTERTPAEEALWQPGTKSIGR